MIGTIINVCTIITGSVIGSVVRNVLRSVTALNVVAVPFITRRVLND